MSVRSARFIQPVDGIEVVSRTDGPRTLLTPEALAEGQRRIAAGEDPERVAFDLAVQEQELIEGLEK